MAYHWKFWPWITAYPTCTHSLFPEHLPNDPKLSHGHWRPGCECNLESQSSYLNRKLKGQWPVAPARCYLVLKKVFMKVLFLVPLFSDCFNKPY